MPKKKVLMAVLALIFAVMQILPAFANELEDKQAEYDDVQQKMQQMEIAKERARREAEAASDRMEEIVAELNRLQAEIKEIEAKRDKLQPLIDENQEVLAEKKAKMEGRMKIYRQRLRDIYKNPPPAQDRRRCEGEKMRWFPEPVNRLKYPRGRRPAWNSSSAKAPRGKFEGDWFPPKSSRRHSRWWGWFG